MTWWRSVVCAGVLLAVAVLPAAAEPQQPAGVSAVEDAAAQATPAAASKREPAVRGGTFEVSGFVGHLRGNPLAGRSALLTPNTTGNPTPTTALFTVALKQKPAATYGARVAYNLTGMFAVEGTFADSRPPISVSIGGDRDVPSIPAFTLAEVRQVFVDVSLVAHFSSLAFAGGRAVPFAVGGGGYLRQNFRSSNETVTGQVYNVGAGLKVLFRRDVIRATGGKPGRNFLKHIGLRADVREYFKTRGIDGERRVRSNAAAVASVLVVF